MFTRLARILGPTILLAACGAETPPEPVVSSVESVEPRPEIYADFELTTDLGHLSDSQRQMIAVLIEASGIMDDLFWRQAFNDGYADWLASIEGAEARRFAELNYGPWDRLANDAPFIEGFGPKPLGANLYPPDMSKDEFESAYLPGKQGLYSLVRRGNAGELVLVPYHVAYKDELQQAAELLREAADLAEDPAFATYLKLRAAALISDDFQASDLFWMDVKSNEVDVVIGPIETYEDRLFGYRAAYESYVLVKDMESTMRATATQVRRRLQSTCPTTSRCSSRRARAGCNSRTRCRPSSRRSCCRYRTR
jgi:hypothetical protein